MEIQNVLLPKFIKSSKTRILTVKATMNRLVSSKYFKTYYFPVKFLFKNDLLIQTVPFPYILQILKYQKRSFSNFMSKHARVK